LSGQVHHQWMSVFSYLSKIRAFEQKHLPDLVTREDCDIVRIIGLYQERLKPLLLKQLFLEGISSFSTVSRRLKRLREIGYVLVDSPGLDRRSILLSLSPQVLKTYLRYGILLKTIATS
jgi:hypothetical protein